MTTLRALPLEKRPREKLLSQGCGHLELEELAAVILRTGTRFQDALQVSRAVCQEIINGNDDPHALAAVPGVGKAKAAVIAAALAFGPAVAGRRQAYSLLTPERVYSACADLLELPSEHLVVFFLNVRGGQLARETVSIGTATASLLHPREVFRPAIFHNATHIILAHNHPSGDPSPSRADEEVTVTLARAGEQVGIELLDHVVCARSGFCSLKRISPRLFLEIPRHSC